MTLQQENISEYLEILKELGYNLRTTGQSIRTQAIYRGGDGYNVAIYPNGNFVDFVTNKKGNVIDLIALSLNQSLDKTLDFLRKKLNKEITLKSLKEERVAKIKMPKKINEDFLTSLEPIHTFYTDKGISKETLTKFGGGFCKSGYFKNRYCFPIYDEESKLIGMTGRLTYPSENQPKWKHKGETKNFLFPIHLNKENIESKREVILVESPFCVVRLYDSGVKNALCLFGTKLQVSCINYLLRSDCNIIVGTNNESSGIGNEAAHKIKAKLNKYFDYKKSKIKLPTKKDFGEMTNEEIQKWVGEG